MIIKRWLVPLVGLLLVIMSAVALVWWEKQGRELLLLEPVAVAAHDISAGAEITGREFREVRVDRAALMSGSIKPGELPGLAGKIAVADIRKGAQVSRDSFREANSILQDNKSVYCIKQDWIDNRSSSLRKGDFIDIYDSEGNAHLGSFQVVHVRDEGEQEVISGELNVSDDIEERDFSSDVVASVEILCSLEEYQEIFRMAELDAEKLLLVQIRGDI